MSLTLTRRRTFQNLQANLAHHGHGFNLPAKFVIHTVGPIWQDGNHGEEQLLRSTYRSSLELARKHGLQSVAFPLISSGVYGWPTDDAISQALSAIAAHRGRIKTVTLVLFDQRTYQTAQQIFDREGYWL